MTIQEYYELQSKLMMLDSAQSTMGAVIEEVRDVFNKIDVNQLTTGTPTPAGTAVSQPPTNSGTPLPPPTTSNSNTSAPVVQPKVRKKLNTPVITGPLGDVVKDMLEEKAAAAEEANGPVRMAPYEVEVKSVSIDGGGNYVARVEDSKNKMEAYVPIGKATYEEFNRDPDGLMVDLDGYILKKIEWIPLSESPMSITTTSVTSLQDVIDGGGEASVFADAAAKNLGVNPGQVVFVDPNESSEV
jgi:hypothetical protein